jgi:Phospholipase_D-nuclease N-terminal
MIDVDGLVLIALFMFWVWALLDCIATDSALCRNLPKPLWVIVVLLLPDIGSLAWLLLGRPEKRGWRPGSTDYAKPRRAIGPEDSPRYGAPPAVSDRRSEELNRELERWEREQRDSRSATAAHPAGSAVVQPDLDAWARQLDGREAELRRRELELRQRELDRLELEQRERDLDQ